jgi:hypothetical protein
VSEKPIIFSGPMVRAILRGEKTQTRRVVKPQPSSGVRYSPFVPSGIEDGHGRELRPRYFVGDTLWVRETWAARPDLPGLIEYKANHQPPCEYPFGHIYDEETRWRLSMFMPRSVSRITLEVTGVRVQRVQEISEEDARAEGMESCTAYDQYRALWDLLNTKRGYGWAWNPWVWAITFRLVEVSA